MSQVSKTDSDNNHKVILTLAKVLWRIENPDDQRKGEELQKAVKSDLPDYVKKAAKIASGLKVRGIDLLETES